MRYLLTNDDGILAPGIGALIDAVSAVGDVHVVAPQTNCSGASHALTLDRPLYPTRMAHNKVAIYGKPVDCVHLAINGFLDFEPDMVISGINAGANLGDDVMYSGTVAAAMEGRFLKIPCMAVSLVNGQLNSDYSVAAEWVVRLLQQWHQVPIPAYSMLNVNVPYLPASEIRGVKVTRLGVRGRSKGVKPHQDLRGHEAYWVGLAGDAFDAELGTDFHAVQEGYVSVTPLAIDWTLHQALGPVADWIKGI
jgi:5'-nucleotidase